MANDFTSNYLEKRRKRIGTAAYAASRSSEKEEEKKPEKKVEEKTESKGSYTSNYLKAREKRTGGTVPSAKTAAQNTVRKESRGSATLNNLDNMGSNRVADLKKRLEEARQKEVEASRAQVQAASELRKTKDGNRARELAAAVQAASDEYNAIKRELDMYEYIDEYKGKVYEDDFVGQFSANKTLGRLSQDTSAAYNEYWQNPTDENRAYAEAMDMLTEYFQQQNAEALDDENAKAAWITKSAAQYLPQWWDQTKATVAGGAAGALAGAGIGFAAGGIGAIPGAIKGAQVGATAASGLQSYGQMRGAAFRELLAAGVDEETARAAANDEGVISGLIEMGDTALTVFTLGTGKLLTALGKGGVKAVAGEAAESGAKRLLKALGKYGVLNIGQEMLEEGTQQAVSIANQDRDNTGKWDLVKESAGTAWDAITGEDKEARSEIWDAAKEGGKIAAMFGGVQRVGDFAVETGIRSHVGKKYTEQMGADTVTAAIETALENEEGSESRKIAEKLQQKQQAGKTVSNADVGALVQAVESEKRAEEVQTPAEATESPQETLENLARETVAQRENAQQAQPAQQETVTERTTVPFNVMAEDNPVRQQKIAESKALEKSLGYGEHGMQTFNEILESSNASVDQVRARFQQAYEAGMTNLPREKAGQLDRVQETAFNAGRMDAALSIKKAEVKGATVWGKAGGLIQNEYSSKLDATTADTLQMIGKATGTKIIMQAQVYGGKANGSYKDGIVTIASDAANPYIVVAKHEVTHRMQDLAPKQYTAYRDYAVQIMAGSGSKMTLVEQYQNRAANSGVTLTVEGAMDEIAADFTEKILTDEKALNDFVNHVTKTPEQRTMGQKFFQAVREFIDKVKRIFKDDRKKMDQAAQEQYGTTIEQLEKAEQLWKEAYRAAEDKAKGLENRGVQEYNGSKETQYSMPVYETKETWKPGAAIDHREMKARRDAAAEQYGLTKDESSRLGNYVGGPFCYMLNLRMLNDQLNDGEKQIAASVESALRKFPEYTGRTYRNLNFTDEQKYNAFMEEHAVGETVPLKAFTSTSKDPNGYLRFHGAIVHMVIDGVSGRDIADTFGLPKQQEVILLPGTKLKVTQVATANDGNPLIFAQEVAANEDFAGETERGTGHQRSARGVHQPEHGHGLSAGHRGAGDGGIHGEVRRHGGRNDVLSERRAGSDAGAVRGEDEGVKYSLRDSEGRELTQEQAEFFKDSKVRDENGNLLVMYHGTKNGGFTVFQNKRRPETEGFYFTNDKKYSYTFEGRKANGQFYPSVKEGIEAGTYNSQRYEVYLDVKKPLVLTADQQEIIEDIGYWKNIYDPVKKAGYDGVMMEDKSQVFVFSSNQIKLVDNKNPTSDPDIRFSLKDEDYLAAVNRGDMETVQKMVDAAAKAAGYKGAYYHGSRSDFTVFSKAEGGQSNSDASIGFWFTETSEGAKKWADETWYGDRDEGKVYKTFLDLKNPKVYETVDNKAKIDELYKGYEDIDKEMSLYDSIYYFEDGRRYHHERYDYDKEKRRRSGISEWDAFKAIVKKYDADTVAYYLEQVPEADRQTVQNDAQRYLELSKERKALEKQISELRYSDAYELYRTDIYKLAGMSAEDANIGGTGKYIDDKRDVMQRFLEGLKSEGHDGILIKNTSYDSEIFGGVNNQYVVFDPNQIKSADPVTYDDEGKVIPLSKRFDTSSDDIRFSLKGQDDLLKQNAKLKEVNQELRDQFKTTKFAKVDKKALRQFAKQLLKDYQSGADIDETRDTLDNVFTYIANGENGESAVWEVAYERAYDAAVSILSNSSTLNDELFQAYKGMRDDIKTTGITINKMYDHDLVGYESINEFRRANFGRIKLVNDGIPVDVFYEGLAYSYPEFFDSDTYMTQADQLSHIEEVLNSLQPTEVNPYSHNMREAATWLANDIMERFFELPQAKPTFADKAERKLTKQVIKDHEKLERLREQKNERIAELIEERREKVKEVAKKEKEKRDQKIREVKEHYREKESKASESRKAKILRERIIRHTQEMSQTLLRPSDKRHIPESLRAPVAAVLDAINLESQYTIDPATGKRQKNVPGDPTKRTLAFTDLRKAYQNIIQDDGADITVDPAMEAMLDLVIDLRDVKLADMNMSQLKIVWDVVRVVEHTINNAGRLLSETKYERTIEWADAMVKDTETRRSKRGGKAEAFRIDMENPYTFFSHYGESGKAIFRMLRDAQDKQQMMVEEVREKVQAIVNPKTVRKLENEVHTFTTESGDKLTLTTAQVMDIYLLTKRQQAHEHLMQGGIVQPEVKSKKIKRGTDAILLSANDLSAIVGKLDAKQKEIADKLQELTRTTLADYGNEASMKAYGYKKFTGTDYWPIKSAREGIHSNVEKGGNNTRSIKNIGLAKTVMPHANNPLDIGGVFQTFASHAGDMTDYAAWLCPMEDANRLFNFQFRDELGNRTGKTIKGLLDRVGGKGSQQYWHNLMEDIQNGIKSQNDTSIMGAIGRVYGNTKGASVAWNIRVIVQQPTAIVRAAAFVNPDAIIRGLFAGGGWKAALKHSPIAQRKDMGGFDISSPMQMNEILFDSKTGLQRFNEVGMAGAAWADRVTWGRIWNFCEQEVRLGRDDLTPRSDEFYEAVNELFTEVVDQSQVVDGVLQRAQIMRSNNALANQATSFMGEPMMAMNMLLRAYDGLVNETNKSKRGKAFKTFGRAAVVLLVTNVVNALAQSLVDAARDDEDDEYWEKFLTAFTGITGEEETNRDKAKNAILEGNLIGGINPLGYVPFVKDLLSIMSGYSVQRADAAIMEDLWQAGTSFFESWNGDGKKTKGNTLLNLGKQVGKVFGVGVGNLTRDVYAALRTAALETGNIPAQYELEKWIYKNSNEKNDARFVDILYKAYQTDKDVYEHIYNDLAAAGMDAKSIKDKMESHMKKDQGVTKVEDLEKRYLHPDEQRTYDSKLKSVSNSSLWRSASTKQKEEVETQLYNLTVGNDDGVKLQEKISDGKPYGLSETEYLLYELALDMVDQPNKSGKLGGSPTNEEKAAAIDKMGNLGNGEIAFLWDSKEGYEAYAAGLDMRTYVERVGDGQSVNVEKMVGAMDEGMSEDDYYYFLDMLKEVDQPTKNGTMGSFTQDEAKAAISAMPGLTREQRAWLWQSVGSNWSAKNNPWK